MSNPNAKYRIKLSEEQRQELIEISKNGTKAAKQVNHAQVLLMSDDRAVEGRWRDEDIGQALNMHVNTIASIRKNTSYWFSISCFSCGNSPSISSKIIDSLYSP